jgi:hypothetical protein
VLVDEAPDRPSAQQLRQLASEMIQCGTIRQLFERIVRQKSHFRRKLIFGE